jgi:hypothetical protein
VAKADLRHGECRFNIEDGERCSGEIKLYQQTLELVMGVLCTTGGIIDELTSLWRQRCQEGITTRGGLIWNKIVIVGH